VTQVSENVIRDLLESSSMTSKLALTARDRLIVALDLPDLRAAEAMVERL
jgi:hypothetical protein